MPLGFSPSRGRPQQVQTSSLGPTTSTSSPVGPVTTSAVNVGASPLSAAAQTLSQGKLTPHRISPVQMSQSQQAAQSMRAQGAQMSSSSVSQARQQAHLSVSPPLPANATQRREDLWQISSAPYSAGGVSLEIQAAPTPVLPVFQSQGRTPGARQQAMSLPSRPGPQRVKPELSIETSPPTKSSMQTSPLQQVTTPTSAAVSSTTAGTTVFDFGPGRQSASTAAPPTIDSAEFDVDGGSSAERAPRLVPGAGQVAAKGAEIGDMTVTPGEIAVGTAKQLADAAAEEAARLVEAGANPEKVDILKVAQAQQEERLAIVQQQAAAEREGKGSKPAPLSISLTRPPPELPQQLQLEYEDDPDLLGEGAFAVVRQLRHRRTGDLVALKVVEKYPLHIREMLPQLQREVRIQGALQHRHILRLLSCLEDDTYVYMLLEFCAGGSLRSLCADLPNHRLPEARASWYTAQILQGVEFMHQRNCVHRDLKPENMLLTEDGEVRICDFGWSAEVQAEQALRTTCGTPHYWAPEIFEGLPQGYPVDLWSLGTLVYELLVGHAPFWGSMEELKMKVMSVDIRYPPGLLSNEAISLFYCFMQREPCNRISASRMLAEHPWVLQGLAALGSSAGVNSPDKSAPPQDESSMSTPAAAAVVASPAASESNGGSVSLAAASSTTAAAVTAAATPKAVWSTGATGNAAAPKALSAVVAPTRSTQAPPPIPVIPSATVSSWDAQAPEVAVVAPAIRPAALGRGTAVALSAALSSSPGASQAQPPAVHSTVDTVADGTGVATAPDLTSASEELAPAKMPVFASASPQRVSLAETVRQDDT